MRKRCVSSASPGPPLRATSRRAVHRATTRGAMPRCRRCATTTGAPRGPGEAPGDGHRFERAAEVQLELAGNRQHAFAHLDAGDVRAGGWRCRRGNLVCRCSSNAPQLHSAEHSYEPPCRLHGTSDRPDIGRQRLLICRNRLDGEASSRRSWHLSALAAVAPASSGLIPQPVSMSARIL